MVDFVGDILRNAYNTDAANWKAPAVTTYAPVAGTRTVAGQSTNDPALSAMYDMFKQQMINQYGSNKWQRDMDGKEQRRLQSLQSTSTPSTTQNYWTVDGTEYGTEAEALAAAKKLNDAQVATNPYNPTGLPGFTTAELIQSGYLNPGQSVDYLSFDPQSSYGAQKAIAMDRFGDDALTRLIKQAAMPGADVSSYLDQNYLKQYLDPLSARADTRIDLQDNATTKYDFGGVFNDAAAQDIVDQILRGERQQVQNTVNTQGGFGYDTATGSSQYARNLYNDTLDDSFIADILGKQQDTATNTLNRALSYGQISQPGLDAALEALGTQRTGAEAQIGDYTTGLLNEYRGLTDADITNLYNTTNTLRLGQDFDATGAISDIQSKANERLGGFEGTLRNQFGDQQFFDVGSLLAEGAKNSGIFDPAASGGLLGKLQSDEQKNQQRGLGSQGSF